MTETEKKALALVNEVTTERGHGGWIECSRRGESLTEALCRAIERHEAFRQEVSDAVEAVFAGYHDAPTPWVVMRRKLEPFIVAKPDPVKSLFDYLESTENFYPPEFEGDIRAALAARGLKIVEVGHD